MAKSGSFNTNSYDGRYYKFSWTATQSSSTSKVSWKLEALGGSADWYAERTLRIIINGKSVYSKTNRVERLKEVVKSGTISIKHNSSGAANLSVSVEAAVFGTAVNVKGSKSFALDKIATKSILTVSDGTLGTPLSMTVRKQLSSHTHTITYKCGSASGTICSKSTSTSIKWTPPLSLANQSSTSNSLSVTYTIMTYSGSTSLGGYNYVRTLYIPDSAAPKVTLSVSDAMGYEPKFGAYLRGASKLKVVVNATPSAGTTISSYKTIADYLSYTSQSFSTDVINYSTGTVDVNTTVRDSRGRTGTASYSAPVYEYNRPKISKLSVHRCNSDGTENMRGAYVKVDFSAEVTSLGGKNHCNYIVRYKITSASTFTEKKLTQYENRYVTNGTYLFPADTGESYHVEVEARDDIDVTRKSTTASTAHALLHFHKSGTSLAIGKIAEKLHALEVGLKAFFYNGVNIDGDDMKDFVIESGEYTEEGGFVKWSYQKWHSGLAECWCTYELACIIEQTWGSLYYGYGNDPINYPFPFIERPVETATMRTESNAVFCYSTEGSVNTTTTSGSYTPCRPTPSKVLQSIKIDIQVLGRWREDPRVKVTKEGRKLVP